MKRPFCNLFVFQTLDGKIKLPQSACLLGIDDYRSASYDTYFWHLISGRALVDVGAAELEYFAHDKSNGLIIVDNPALSQDDIDYITECLSDVIIITYGTRKRRTTNTRILRVKDTYDVAGWMETLYVRYNVELLTVHGGGELNASLLRAGLIDSVDVFISPIILGGNTTPTLAGGEALKHTVGSARLSSLQSTSYPSGCVRLHYTVLDAQPRSQ